MKSKIFPIFAILILAFSITIYFLLIQSKPSEKMSDLKEPKSIMNFDKCLTTGKIYKESFPRVCTYDDTMYFENEGEPVNYKDRIIIDYPVPADIVSSPLIVRGKVRGSWVFEANFPVSLDLLNSKVINFYAETLGEWMTPEYVDFTGTVEFEKEVAKDGILTFHKANASGLEENEDSISIFVRFE